MYMAQHGIFFWWPNQAYARGKGIQPPYPQTRVGIYEALQTFRGQTVGTAGWSDDSNEIGFGYLAEQSHYKNTKQQNYLSSLVINEICLRIKDRYTDNDKY